MSRNLLKRGRYPKGSGVEQIAATNSQYPATSSPFSVAPEMPYYGGPSQTPPAQNTWSNPSYSVPGTYQQNQIPSQPVPDPINYWSTGQMYTMPAQPQPSEQWSWKPGSSENVIPTNYHQSSVQSTEQWQQTPYSVVDNQNYSEQPMTFPPTEQGFPRTSDFQYANNNPNTLSQNPPLSAWENESLNLTQPDQLPWTYSSPQYNNSPQPIFSQNFNPTPTNPSSWNNSSGHVIQPESNTSECLVNYLPTESSSAAQSYSEAQMDMNSTKQNSSNELIDQSNIVSETATSTGSDHASEQVESIETDYDSSTLSAFFQNNAQDNVTNSSECEEISIPEVKHSLDSSSLAESMAHMQINESEKSSLQSEEIEPDEDTDESQRNDFIQEEGPDVTSEDLASKSNSESPSAFVEEPVNQEVPEPCLNESVNIKSSNSLQSQKSLEELDNLEVSPDEPLNQQIPLESGHKSRSTSAERERIVIHPREDSPFKPPRISSSKGIVQQEVTTQNVLEVKKSEKTVVQAVNLETYPDNLERPPDYEELRKQSPLYVSHQKHLRTELNSSPSSLLCDNPDIPCVTLAPAAPPIYSSSKSDKSESSCDSKQDTHSLDISTNLSAFMNGSKIKSSSPLNEAEYCEKSKSVGSLNAIPLESESSYKPTSNKNQILSSDRKENPSNVYQNAQNQGKMYLKDSIINGSHVNRPAEPLRRQREQPQTPNSSHSGSSKRDSDFAASSKVLRDNSTSQLDNNRQRFADQKYQSFDERQYYSDRERSRPPSRSSLGERTDDYMYSGKRDDCMYPPGRDRRQGPPEYPRPSSRMSESDISRQERQNYDYYRQQYPYGDPYPRQPDYYQRQPSNYRGYDYDSYQRDSYYASYYDAYRYAYNNYNYGFYDELYRNDPRYKQYHEQYRQYYAKYGYEADYERSSIHSGSSANELSKDITPSQYDIDSNESEFSACNLQQDYSYAGGPNDSSILPVDQSSSSSNRLTPVKFSYAHPIVRFSSNGLLITSIPSQVNLTAPSSIRIQSLQLFVEKEESFQELKNYQGPLIRGLTHKNDVVDFCTQKIKALKLKDVVDRDSYILLWELMILLLRQNGSVAGSDIAELLLKDHEVLRPLSVPLKQTIETPQGESSPADVNDSSSQSHAGDASSPDEGIVVLNDKNILNTSRTVDVDKVTRKFREFLLFGHKKDALEWAMKHGLWGHALFLASKMDLRTYASVMTRFANSLALNDPLQTLYQLMSGRQPSAVTFVADKKWGDWRPHLAMILSNPSGHPDVDSRSITTLGDTLASRGCLPAAHFCYIMAQVEFGTFDQKSSKLVLLSADHRLPFDEFATNEAIQCTEIYEYAQSLANPGYMLSHLQMYKFLYALRLIEHGCLEEGLHYLEVIAGNFHSHPNLFLLDFISEVFKLGSQLKYHDPHFMRGQGELEDQDDPEWLKNLSVLVQNYNNIIQGLNSHHHSEFQQQEPVQTFSQEQTQIAPEALYQNIPGQSIQNEIPGSTNRFDYQHSNWGHQSSGTQDNVNFSRSQPENANYYQNGAELHNNRGNFLIESSLPSHEENETTDVPSSPVAQTSTFDYYSNSQAGQDSRQSSFDYGGSYSNTALRRERRDSAMSSASRYSAGSMSVSNKSVTNEVRKTETKKENKQNTQVGKTWLGGIFSRLLPKAPNQMILPDDKNPTIVWDDNKNCWVNKDSNDDDESAAPLAPPTDMELMGSKSSDKPMMPPNNAILPNNSMPTVDNNAVNKFQRPKTRVMRQNYVDVFNTSGAATKANVPPEALFPSTFGNTVEPKMFVPTAVNANEENNTFESVQESSSAAHIDSREQIQTSLTTPLMLDPAEFDSSRSNTSHRLTLGRTGRRTYPT